MEYYLFDLLPDNGTEVEIKLIGFPGTWIKVVWDLLQQRFKVRQSGLIIETSQVVLWRKIRV